jgi:hypothetical protein
MVDEPRSIDPGHDWEIVRTDENGHTFPVRSGMTEEEARQLQDVLIRRGHKQLYEFRRSSPVPRPL